jgi:hypothetical protein
MSIISVVNDAVEKVEEWLGQTGEANLAAVAATGTSTAEAAVKWVSPYAEIALEELVDGAEWVAGKAMDGFESAAESVLLAAEEAAEAVKLAAEEAFEGFVEALETHLAPSAAQPSDNAAIQNAMLSCAMEAGMPSSCTDAQGHDVSVVISDMHMYFIEADVAVVNAAEAV